MNQFIVYLVSAVPSALILSFSLFIILKTLRRRRPGVGEIKPLKLFACAYAALFLILASGLIGAAALVEGVFYFILAASAFCFLFFIKTGKDNVVIVESIVRVASLFKPKPPKDKS